MKATINGHVCAWFLGVAIAAIAAAPSVLGMPAQPAASRPPVGGAAEGINIHGHWTIDVRNPDGSLVSHHEFDNALNSAGSSALAGILSRSLSFGTWVVDLEHPVGPAGPCDVDGKNADCMIVESANVNLPPQQPNRIFRNLAIAKVDGTVRLSGQATMTSEGPIGRVSTFVGVCAGTVAPAACVSQSGLTPFTSHTLTPIPVVAGQIVQVTVVLSFS